MIIMKTVQQYKKSTKEPVKKKKKFPKFYHSETMVINI